MQDYQEIRTFRMFLIENATSSLHLIAMGSLGFLITVHEHSSNERKPVFNICLVTFEILRIDYTDENGN
jgi:hypothetical protein